MKLVGCKCQMHQEGQVSTIRLTTP